MIDILILGEKLQVDFAIMVVEKGCLLMIPSLGTLMRPVGHD